MSYSISSKEFNHPLIKPILEKLTRFFASIDVKFYVIGATARDIILNIHGERSGRATRDLDIAIAISNWEEYKTIEEGIVNIEDFEKDKTQKQRFIFRKNFELDIVPFGDVMKEDDKIFWPPDETVAMSILGFAEVNEATNEVKVDDDLSIEVATLAGVFILKLVAWKDRNLSTNKDADDMGFIINNYLSIHEQQAVENYYDEIYSVDNFNTTTGGALLLGFDMAKIVSERNTKNKLTEIIESEIAKKEESKLINQIIETNKLFKYEETLQCLENIAKGLNIHKI